MKAYTRDGIPALLRRHGINPTRQRIEIGHALFSRGEHMSADQVLAAVNSRGPETSRATVYNTLNLFVQQKMIRRVIVDPTRIFYDPNTGEHHHLYDVVNGRLTDIAASEVRVTGLPKLPKEWLPKEWMSSSVFAPRRLDRTSAADSPIIFASLL